MSQSRIRLLYESRLKTWADARAPVLPIVWQNVGSTPDDTYLMAFIIPAPTESDDLEGAHRAYSGVFQVSIVAPIGNGPQFAEGIAEELQALFPVNLRLTVTSPEFSVQTITPMSIGPEIQESEKYTLPVSAQYRADDI